MYPIIRIFERLISTYVVLAVIGILVSGIYFCRNIKMRGLDDNDAIIWLLICSAGVVLGGHVLFALTNLDKFSLYTKVRGISDFIAVTANICGGSIFYGGLIGAMIFGAVWIRIKKLDFIIYSDTMASAAPLFHSFARVGCFLGGCCYGIESEFGFTAHNNPLIPDLNDVSRFPVQLLEAALNLVLFAVFRRLLNKNKFRGILFPMYLISYAVIRFGDEFLRGDIIRGFAGALSTSQWISIYMIIFAVSWICFHKKQTALNSKQI